MEGWESTEYGSASTACTSFCLYGVHYDKGKTRARQGRSDEGREVGASLIRSTSMSLQIKSDRIRISRKRAAILTPASTLKLGIVPFAHVALGFFCFLMY